MTGNTISTVGLVMDIVGVLLIASDFWGHAQPIPDVIQD